MRFKPVYKQLTIDGFRSSLDGLDKGNRWVWLGDHLPWEEFEKQYGQTLKNQTAGAGEKPAGTTARRSSWQASCLLLTGTTYSRAS